MLDEINPMLRANPFYEEYKLIGKYNKMNAIPQAEIDGLLVEIEVKCMQIEMGTKFTHLPASSKEKFKIWIEDHIKPWVNDIRKDLSDTSKFVLKDNYYVRI